MARQIRSKTATILTSLTTILLSAAIPAGAHPLYVDLDSTAVDPEGESWSDAFDDLQDALAAAHTDPNVHVIRIADGTYNPHGSDRTVSFVLEDGVAIEGGYVGISGDDPDERDWDIYVTILSGELSAAGMFDNSYHVITCDDTVTTRLEGLTIERGNANGGVWADRSGGGIRNGYSTHVGGTTGGGTLQIDDCTFTENHADGGGGGMSNVGNPATLTRCTFTDNDADGAVNQFGGGAFYNRSDGDPNDTNSAFTDCDFDANDALGNGGAIWSGGAVTVSLTGCTFDQNTGGNVGGAILLASVAAVTIDECEFTSNSAKSGGAMHIGGQSDRTSNVTDTTFTLNSATGTGIDGEGGAIWTTGFVDLSRCMFDANTAQKEGGAVHIGHVAEADAVIEACIFDGNTAVTSGGAVFENSSAVAATYINSLFVNNTASGSGEAEGGGAIRNAGSLNVSYVNCTFVANKAIGGEGGGIRILDNQDPKITNCIFWDNGDGSGGSTQDESAQIHLGNGGSVPVVKYCTIEGCDAPGFCDEETNKAVEPTFVGSGAHPYQLQDIGANGALIDDGDGENVGTDCFSANTTTKDLAGDTRFIRDDGVCVSAAVIIDIGAYEVQ